MLKLDVAFLYDLLGASQEHKIKPKKFAQTDIDEVIIGHTNEPEYKKLQNNEFMEALRDRTVKIDIPYITRLSGRDPGSTRRTSTRARSSGKHIAPHTLEVAAMWAVLTRLEDPKKHNLSLLQKMKLYDGKMLPGYTQDTVKELRKEASAKAWRASRPRYVQDKISNALVNDAGEGTINPFMVMNELEGGSRHHSLITKRRAAQALTGRSSARREARVRGHREERGPARDRADEDAIAKLCRELHRQRQGLHPAREGEEPLHRPGRGAGRAPDAVDRGEDRHPREPEGRLPPRDHELHRRARGRREAVRLEDQRTPAPARSSSSSSRTRRTTIKLKTLVSAVVDKDTQEKIDIIKIAAHQELRLQRGLRDRRAELRREHLRARRREE